MNNKQVCVAAEVQKKKYNKKTKKRENHKKQKKFLPGKMMVGLFDS